MTDSHEVESLSDERAREIVAAFSPAECDVNCDDPFCPYIHQVSFGEFTREEYNTARALLNDINRKPTPEGK